ncbi:MAG TPA: hypothetical protein VGR89_05650 [Puia sp.]|nr:hypothetical protein [Puia sp.]
MRINIVLLVLPAISMVVWPACKKKTSAGTSMCQIITVTDQEGASTTTIKLTYDGQGRVSTKQLIRGSDTILLVFTYSGNTEIVQTSGPGLAISDSMTLNSYGQAESDYESDGTNTYVTINTYSGDELQTSIYNYGSGPDTTTNSWTNGDLTSSTTRGVTTTYSYNSKASEEGDYFWLVQGINFGGDLIRTAHQLISSQNPSGVLTVNYTYDGTGKITEVAYTSGSISGTDAYQYSCR